MTMNLDGILSADEVAEYNATHPTDLESKLFVLLTHLIRMNHAASSTLPPTSGSPPAVQPGPSVAPPSVQPVAIPAAGGKT